MADEERRARIRLSAQNGAVRALMSSDTADEAIPAVLGAICENLGWTVGQLWQPDDDGETLRLAHAWCDPLADIRGFIDAGRKASITRGVGLPGRVWEDGSPAWISDILDDPNFPRREAARLAGLRGGFGVPVPLSPQTVGVMEFFTRQVLEPDEELLATMESLGSQIGQFVERRRAEAALRESEERFRTFAKTVPDATFVIDQDSRIVYVNEAVREIFGYDPSELIGEPLTRLMPEEYRTSHLEGIRRYVETGERRIPWDGIELPGLRRDGTTVPLEITYGAYQKDGLHFFTGIARDIAERKRAESRLRFQADLLDAVGEAVIATDLDGRILYWNAYAERLYGWTAEEVTGRDIAEITPAAISRDRAREILNQLKDGENWTGEFLVHNRDGREFPVLVIDSPIRSEDGELIGVIGVSTEITERKRAEAAQRFLAEAGRALGASLDFETTLRSVARLVIPTLGSWAFVQSARVGEGLQTWARAYPEEDHDRAETVERLLTEAGQAFVRRTVRDERPVFVNAEDFADAGLPPGLAETGVSALLAAPLRARGEAVGVLLVVRTGAGARYREDDAELAAKLADRAALAADNAILYSEAQEANRAKADFLAVVSHELRTPLNAITGYADLMSSGIAGELTEKQTNHVERIKVGARHLAQLIDEILAYARVEAGRETVTIAETDLTRIVEEAAVVIRPIADDKRIDLRVDVPDGGLVLATDGGKFRQVVVNLLSNAVKYTDAGEVEVTLRSTNGGGVELTVKDTGVGIAREDLERIFEPFWQAEPPNTRTTGGTGLGLSVNRRLLNMLGGGISVESEPGTGSTFRVTLPESPPRAKSA